MQSTGKFAKEKNAGLQQHKLLAGCN